MQTDVVDLVTFAPEHIPAAVRLSQQTGWPHRREDWELVSSLSQGIIAMGNNEVLGTILMTPYGCDTATINMVIVDEAARGKGLGRRLMTAAVSLSEDRSLRLIATEDGLPLYEKLGFERVGVIGQYQGVVSVVASPDNVEPAESRDLMEIIAIDRLAFGAERGGLIEALARTGEFAVLRGETGVIGFAALRPFGRGEVIGPVIAANLDDAKALISYFLARRTGAFLRIDTPEMSGLAVWLQSMGLSHVGGGIAMQRPPVSTSTPSCSIFALASQALG